VIAKLATVAALFFVLSFPAFPSVACIPFDQAQKHIGETQCVSGKVLRVEAGSRGVHYLDFCEDYSSCSFSVVVFASVLKRIGDVDQLAGKTVEIRGEVKEFDGRAEIVLENARQLGGEAT
jgi:DNA/RNA endonuclease YhcR with UshA esterase domain